MWKAILRRISVVAAAVVAAVFIPGAGPGGMVWGQEGTFGGPIPAQAVAAADERVLEEELSQPMDVEFVETPLKDAFAHLQEKSGIQFVLKVRRLEEAGVNPDTPVSISLKRVRLRTLLELVLEPLELNYLVKENLVLVTTPEDTESNLVTRVYDCRDLLALPDVKDEPDAAKAPKASLQPAPCKATPQPAPGNPGAAVTGGSGACGSAPLFEPSPIAIVELTTNTIEPQSWSKVGGPGHIELYKGLLTISQSDHTHRKVEGLLDMLRRAAGLEVAPGAKVVR